ncbi:hypothetical protein B566_EDAN016324 [Ephemera danica]|nr:hypothetical protein B566_EDAN016324 [Ephemera danica]
MRDICCLQVAEVLTQDRFRITIGGWFHLNLADWVNPQYLKSKYQQRINAILEDKSEVGLIDFLLPTKLRELEVALNKANLPWKFVGPPNQRHYEVLDMRVPVPGESAVVWEFLQLMQSDLMFDLLFKFSELNLAGVSEDAKEEDSVTPARGHVELQRWTPGCYTALHDMEVRVAMLETIFHIGYKEHSQDAGGSIFFLDQTTGSPVRGGTGFLGTAITNLLRQKGYSVVIVSRMPGPQRLSWIDIQRSGIPEDCKVVINVAGQNILDPMQRWTAGFKQNVWASRVNTTKSLANAITNAGNKPDVFVTVSGVEESPGGDFDFLSRLCTDWEEAAKLPESSGVRQAMVRCGVVLGRQGGMIKQLYTPFFLGVGGPVGSGRQFLPWIHIHDIARLFLFAVQDRRVSGVLNGVAPNVCTNKEFSKAFARALWRPCLFPVPEFMLNLAFGSERAQIMTRGQHVIPQRALDLGFQFSYPDVESACQDVAKLVHADEPQSV